MLNNTIYKTSNIVLGNIFSFFVSPVYKFWNLFRKKHDLYKTNIKTILVTEYHRIGDILLINSALVSIKNTFPDAKLILICNELSINLAKELKIADEVLAINVPWTEWDWSVSKWLYARSFAKNLKRKNIDLAFDFKGDFRNSWFLWHISPKFSFGYNTTGGGYFFTHSFKMNYKKHQAIRAGELVAKAGCDFSGLHFPELQFNKNGSIVIHIGSSNENKAWPLDHWANLVELVILNYRVTLVQTPESDLLEKILKHKELNIEIFKGDLAEFKIWLKNQYCLIGLDSMAGHLAAYVGIPVFTIFGSNDPELTRPISENGEVIIPEKICYHKRTHWRFCQKCLVSISPKKVAECIIKKLSILETQ